MPGLNNNAFGPARESTVDSIPTVAWPAVQNHRRGRRGDSHVLGGSRGELGEAIGAGAAIGTPASRISASATG